MVSIQLAQRQVRLVAPSWTGPSPRRADLKLPLLRVAADAGGFALELPQAWLDENPLTAAALESEADYWKAVGMKLTLSGLSEKKVAVLSRP